MGPLPRRFLRTAIVFLVAGLLLGLWMMAGREFGVPLPARALSAHTHAVLVGFVMMMIGGVALWMFPRPAKADRRHEPRLAEWAYWTLTSGTAGRLVLELAAGPDAGIAMRGAIFAAGAAQVAGLLLLFSALWPRIRTTRVDG
ncbi:MAG: cbb3-type cytochrome c oxidase subunit I [Proteobacteria bacterium]|nr:cbb3-type cytochrome c oxidase subunit I [Pseudomonadota bacterium]